MERTGKRLTRRQLIKYLAAGVLTIAVPGTFGLRSSLAKNLQILEIGSSINPLSPDPSWQLTNPGGILLNPGSTQRSIWNTGHVSDVLMVGKGTIAVASDAGGIWYIQPNGTTLPPEFVSLNSPWPNPDFPVACGLAIDPNDNTHFYAGGSNGLYESPGSGSITPIKSVNLPTGTSVVNRIALTVPSRNIIVACDNGVYSAPIGQSPGPYSWSSVSGNDGGSYQGLTIGPNDSFVVAANGNSSSHSGIFYAPPSSSGYVLNTANIQAGVFYPNIFVAKETMARVSLASCASNLSRMYAVSASQLADQMLAIHRSQDGGKTWQLAGGSLIGSPDPKYTIVSAAGNQAWYNQSVAVSPTNPDLVAVAFRNSSPFISSDGGNSWRVFKPTWSQNQGVTSLSVNVPDLHGDLHSVYFDPSDPNGKRLFIAGDGGIVEVEDCTASDDQLVVSSDINQNLANLEFLSQPSHEGNYGSFSVLPLQGGSFLLVGGLQDNGDVYSVTGSNGQQWYQIDGGDGGAQAFIATQRQDLIHECDTCGSNPAVTAAHWNGTTLQDDGAIPIRNAGSPSDSTGVNTGNGGAVILTGDANPDWKNSSGQYLYAIAANAGNNIVYGLFVNPDSTDMHWEQLLSALLPIDLSKDAIWSLGSGNGAIYVGTQSGKIFAPGFVATSTSGGTIIESPTWLPFSINNGKFSGNPITQILVNPGNANGKPPERKLGDPEAFAIQGNSILRLMYGGSTFNRVGTGSLPEDEQFFGLAADWTGGGNEASAPRLWAANDSRVFLSADQGNTWIDISNGLPTRPHCCDLRYASPYLFLATYGRSVWQTSVD
ncbi:MAG: WD40/YVTN/BNR-like repeat-containing protein [Candidatus Bathyarchaeia archaeon]